MNKNYWSRQKTLFGGIFLSLFCIFLSSCMWGEVTRPSILRHIFISNKSGTAINPTSINSTVPGKLIVTTISLNEVGAIQLNMDGRIMWRYDRSTNTSSGGVYVSGSIDKSTSDIEYNTSAYLVDGSIVLCGSDKNIKTGDEIPLMTHLNSQGKYIKDIYLGAGFGNTIKNGRILSCIKSGNKIIVAAVVLGVTSSELWIFSFSDPTQINWISKQYLSNKLLPNENMSREELLHSTQSSTSPNISYWGANGSSYNSIDSKYIIFHVTDNNISKIYILNLNNNLLLHVDIASRSYLLVPTSKMDNIYLYVINNNRISIIILDLKLRRVGIFNASRGGVKIVWGGFIQNDQTLLMYGESGFGLLVSPVIAHSTLNVSNFASKNAALLGEARGPFAQVATYLPQNQYAIATPVAKDESNWFHFNRRSSGCDITILSTQK